MDKQTALFSLFNPSSIAVVGASNDSKKVGHICLKNVIDSGFKGKLYCINLNETEILGIKCYKSVSDLPEKPDLVVIAIPAESALKVTIECGEQGIKNVVIFSAGFKEVGAAGAELENQLIEVAKNFNINILGPNCFGFVNNKLPINTTFGKVIKEAGILRFISQSGAIAASLFDYAQHVGFGFDQFVTLGNKAVLDENSVLDFWLNSDLKDSYSPIGMYLESITDGVRFLELAKKITPVSPIFVLKPGKSREAQHAMQSHTGSLAGEDYVLDKALQSAGVIRCYGLEDVFDLSKAFSWLLFPSSPKVAVISNAGGPAVMSADIVSEYNLELAQIGPDSSKYLSEHLPRAASLIDPIDILGDALADRYEIALTEVLKQEDIGSVVVLLTPQVMTQVEATAQKIVELKEKFNKPIICSFIGGGETYKGEEILNKHKIPCYRYPERAIRILGLIWMWKKWQKKSKAHKGSLVFQMHNQDDSKISALKYKSLSCDDVNSILKNSKIKVPQSFVVNTVPEALTAANSLSYPVVAKISLPGVMHKARGGGVVLDITNEEGLKNAFNELKHFEPTAEIFIQKQVDKGLEVIIGIKKDPSFSYLLLLGAGGSYTEMIKDRNVTLFSDTYSDMLENIGSTVIYRLSPNQKGILDVVDRLLGLVNTNPIFSEIEINPLIVTKNEVWAVDGKAILL